MIRCLQVTIIGHSQPGIGSRAPVTGYPQPGTREGCSYISLLIRRGETNRSPGVILSVSEGSRCPSREILRCAQDDTNVTVSVHAAIRLS